MRGISVPIVIAHPQFGDQATSRGAFSCTPHAPRGVGRLRVTNPLAERGEYGYCFGAVLINLHDAREAPWLLLLRAGRDLNAR